MKIGLLLPSSNFVEGISKDIKTGFSQGLKEGGVEDAQLLFETGGYNASKNLVQDKVQAMLLKDEVDLVMSPMNVGMYKELEGILSSNNVPLIAINMGADPYYKEERTDWVFDLSINQFRSAWMMGNYAAKHLGPKGQSFTCLHEGGYAQTLSGAIGIEAAGGKQVFSGVTHRAAREEDPTDVLEAGMIDTMDFALGYYSSKEAVSFLNAYWGKGLSSDKLIGNFFMIEDDVLAQVGEKALGIRTCFSWDRNDLSNPMNAKFIKEFEEQRNKRASAFGLVAYEAGLLLAQAIRAGGNLKEALAQAKAEGPRGEIAFNQGDELPGRKEYLMEVAKTEDGTLYQKTVEELEVPELYYEQRGMVETNMSKQGWVNPYLVG